MPERDEDRFLDDIAQAEAEQEAAMAEDAGDARDDIETLRAERDALQDKFMRALADAENARKRAQKDRMEAENYAGTRLVITRAGPKKQAVAYKFYRKGCGRDARVRQLWGQAAPFAGG